MENNADALERILEEGISRYAESEPLAGLEERIMARVRATESKPQRSPAWWAVLAVGLALLAVVAPIYLRPVQIVSKTTMKSPERVPIRIEETRASQQPRRHRQHRAALPKLAVFPTPSPLTAEEKGLLAMVKQDPEGVLRKRGSEPLEIAPLVIPPLETGEEQ